MASQMRLGEKADSGNALRVRKLVPTRFFEWMQIHGGDDRAEEMFEATLIRERHGITAMSFDNPLDTSHSESDHD
jgi:hypothetical protein